LDVILCQMLWRGGSHGGQPGLFDVDERYASLSAAGDPLERLRAVVDFELFRGELDTALDRSDRARGGRPPYDAVLMFKVLVLQTLYALSDDQTEYQIRDRLSFMRPGRRANSSFALSCSAGPTVPASRSCRPRPAGRHTACAGSCPAQSRRSSG